MMLLTALASRGSADEARETGQLVDRSRIAVAPFRADSTLGAFRVLATRAKGMFIAPQLFEAAWPSAPRAGSAFSSRESP